MFRVLLGFLVLISIGCTKSADHGSIGGNPPDKPPTKPQCDECDSKEMKELLDSVSGVSVNYHLIQLYDIAMENGGNRSAGSPGHLASVEYIENLLILAGYVVTRDNFDFIKFTKDSGAFSQVLPDEIEYVEEKDFEVMSFSPAGTLTGSVESVDLDLGPGNASTSGCEIEDFGGFTQGKIALVQRGACTFRQKVTNAQLAGAIAILIFNQGNEETRKEVFGGTLGSPEDQEVDLTIPALSLPYDLGVLLSETSDLELSLDVKTRIEEMVTMNLIAETPGGNPNNVVMLGSHLDSVDKGPGINDNGSGSASILEVALNLKNIDTLNNKVRFAWWSAEELGLVGSTKYVEKLSEEEKAKIALYLNFDMVGSPNYMLGVFDGDGSRFGDAGPEGSGAIEQLLHNFFTNLGSPSTEIQASGRSDYAPFAAAGIPYGGTFTGAEGTKTQEMVDLYGGLVGEAFDSCYHKACDDYNNIDVEALGLNVDAIAYMALLLSGSTEQVNGLTPVPLLAEEGADGGGVFVHGHHEEFSR